MNVYVESNFVLELALLQEQSSSCEAILDLIAAEQGRLRLLIPAFSLAEPSGTLRRRRAERYGLKQVLDQEFKLLARTRTYTDRLQGFSGLSQLLVDSAQEEEQRLANVRDRLLGSAEIIPLSREILSLTGRYLETYRLEMPDSIVHASVVSHLSNLESRDHCFLNRNFRDFGDPNLVEELADLGCKLITSFAEGHRFLLGRSAQ